MRWFSGEDKVKNDSVRAIRAIADHPARSLGVYLRPVEKVVESMPFQQPVPQAQQGRYVGFGSEGSQFQQAKGPLLRTRPVADRDVRSGSLSVDRAGLVDVVLDVIFQADEWEKWKGTWPLVISMPGDR
jgi:hypothetical protein